MIADKNAFDVEMVTPDDDDDDSTFNNMSRSSGQTSGTQLLDASIEDVRNKKNTMDSKIDWVISLMNKVEYEEKAAEQAKHEADHSCSDIMLKVHELTDRQQCVKKKNDMLAREAYVHKKLLSTKMESLQLHVTSLLDKGDRSLELLDEMSRSLEVRLTSAIMKKKSAIKKKQGNEAFARAALVQAETRMAKVEEESNRLKQEAVEISKLQEFLIDRGHLVTLLHGEISVKCQDVKQLKEELDQVVPPGGKTSSSKISSVLASSSSSLVSSIQPEPADSEKGSGSGTDITRSIKKVKIKGKLHGFQVKIKRKLYGNQTFAKCIKKVKLKGKLHGNEMCAKSIKKMKIKSKLHGNQICAKSIKKPKIKGKRHGSHVGAKSIKKLKIKGKRHGRQVCARSIKNLKIQGKRHRSQICAKSIKKVKIKIELHRNQLCPKSQVKIRGKQQGYQICAKSIKKVKIKGLQVLQKRMADADHKD
ncbi:hypothetical protein HanHA89_Chr04g0159261 [Helianthus annuus]|nr:hypothetical protein HanHA89_Chr04g0159261 [Helianthus annuus]